MSILIVGKYSKVDPKLAPHLGHRATKNGIVAGDLRCTICGKWYSWSSENKQRYIIEKRWNFQKKEPEHCGSSHCQDYQRRYHKHLKRMTNDNDYRDHMSLEIFGRLRREGLVA